MPTLHRQPQTIDSLLTLGIAKCRITHVDLATAGTSEIETFNTLAAQGSRRGCSVVPANSRIMYAWINILTAFSGGAVSALVAKLGDAGSDNELITNVSLFTGASGLKVVTGAYTLGTFEAAYAPIITFTSTDGNTADLTAGAIEVCIQYQTIRTESVTG